MATQAERRAATRGRLVTAARELFATDGYDATTTTDILTRAGVSRGAMYHHFETKADVFEAVFTEVSDEAITRATGAGPRNDSPLEELIVASLAWLRVVRAPDVATILLDQGPQVLGWERARDLEARTSLALMTSSLERAAAAGEIQVGSVDLTARLLNAVLAEAALAALHGDTDLTASDQEAEIRRLFERWLAV